MPLQTKPEEVAATQAVDNNCKGLSPHARAKVLAHVELYLNYFIGIVQGGLEEILQINWNLLCDIDELFHPKTKGETASKDPILLKKLCKGDAN